MSIATPDQAESGSAVHSTGWSYEEAFKRNRGLITEAEQEKLRHSRVAIAGMGGVGGVHLVTLARLGIGKFTIADPDVFEVANFNRQYGATLSNLGRNKAEVMAETALDINPELDLRVLPAAVDERNVDEFLADADLFVDGLDFFAIDARRLVFRRAAEQGIWAITAGPIGFSTAWLTFDPAGMTFDRYFDLHDGQQRIDQLIAFAVGLTPKATHLPYIDLTQVDIAKKAGPSASVACQLASGVAGVHALRVLLKRPGTRTAPCYLQFDAYRGLLRPGRLARGNRGWPQRLKRRLLRRRFQPEVGQESKSSQSTTSFLRSLPPIHRYVPLVLRQTFSRQVLERVPEPEPVTDQPDHVLAYDQVMTTKLAIAYAIALEYIYRARPQPFRGRALDLACGPGHMSLCLAKYLKLDVLHGIDLSSPMVALANKNAAEKEMRNANFKVGDATDLAEIDDNSYDLCTFCDAAHHMPDLAAVHNVLVEMDRVTRRDGLIFVMDLVRLKTPRLTESYVNVTGGDYDNRSLSAFYDDFYNSMYAAWTTDELAQTLPKSSPRIWYQLAPAGLPTIQFLFGVPAVTRKPFLRHGFPWPSTIHPLGRELHPDWRAMRQTLRICRPIFLQSGRS